MMKHWNIVYKIQTVHNNYRVSWMLPWSWDDHWSYLRIVEVQCFKFEKIFNTPPLYNTNGIGLHTELNGNIKGLYPSEGMAYALIVTVAKL